MKKILTLVACLSLVASLAIGGSIAYLTATDEATNTFTIGNVSIKIQENLDGEESSALPFVPGTTTTKEVSIMNDGVSPAYVWLTISLDPSNAADYLTMNYNNSSDWTKLSTGAYLYNKILPAGETTSVCLESVSFNSNIDIDGENLVQWVDKEKQTIGSVNDYGTVDVLVNAYAIQADGITSPEKAYNLYFDQTGIGGTVEVPATEVNTASDLMDALAAGDSVSLTDNITQSDSATAATLSLSSTEGVTLDLNDKTVNTSIPKSSGAVVKNTGTANITNGTITSSAANGGSAITNSGTLTVTDATINGAPNEGSSWPSYTVNNTGVMTIKDTAVTSVHGGFASYGEGAVLTLENSTLEMTGIPGFTSHGLYTYDGGKIIVKSGTYKNNATDQNATGASVINGNIEILGGTFVGRIENYYGTPVIKGGTFSVDPSRFVDEGYIATNNGDGTWTVSAN